MAETNTLRSEATLRTDEVLQRLRQACREAGSQKAWAYSAGFSAAFVGDVLGGRRPISDNILRCLGLQRAEVSYVTRQPEPIELYGADGEVAVRAERLFV
jgi:hypothetical protein